ncbi:MAG: Dabb family protein [Cytophagales bacterium]|nr:Dabb family protein [Cytophagales bacterium]
MIKHIVCWRVKEEANGQSKNEIIAQIKNELDGLVSVIEEIKELEVGINYNEAPAAFDVSLYSVFESKDTLQAYQVHPAHQKVAQYIGSVASERVVVDYEI